MDEKSFQLTKAHLKQALPDITWIISDINREDGFLGFPQKFINLLMLDEHTTWAHLYENLSLFKGQLGIEVFGEKKIRKLTDEISKLSGEALDKRKSEIKQQIMEKIASRQFGLVEKVGDTPPDDYLETLYYSDQARSEFVQTFTIYLPQIHQYLALMTHGMTMTDLVEKAKSGDDKALCQAVQIDKTVLTDIPYFAQRLARAQLGNEPEFLKRLSNAIKGKVLGHRMPHRKLWMVFAMLDDDGTLEEISLDQLLDLCTELNVHGGITDTNTLGKRRREYLSRKGSQNAI